jgi:hypothetical protein
MKTGEDECDDERKADPQSRVARKCFNESLITVTFARPLNSVHPTCTPSLDDARTEQIITLLKLEVRKI